MICALLVAALPTACGSPEPEQLFKQFGLFGTWAVDCAQPAAPGNPHVTVRQPSPSEILEEHHLGDDHPVNRYSVLKAEKLSDTRLQVTALLHPGTDNEERQTLVFRVRDHTRRTVSNRPEGGPLRVKDGMVVGSELETPVLHKCE